MKFKIGGKEVFRSKIIYKNLNPVWEEKAAILVDHLREPLYVKVSHCLVFPNAIWHKNPCLMVFCHVSLTRFFTRGTFFRTDHLGGSWSPPSSALCSHPICALWGHLQTSLHRSQQQGELTQSPAFLINKSVRGPASPDCKQNALPGKREGLR